MRLLPLLLAAACALPPLHPPAVVSPAALQTVLLRHLAVDGYWEGSAFPIAQEGHLALFLTARHVLSKVDEQAEPDHSPSHYSLHSFTSPDYQNPSAVTPVLMVDPHPTLDVALVLVSVTEDLRLVPLNMELPRPGDLVTISGYVGFLSLAPGVVGSKVEVPERPYWPVYCASATTYPGSSGGPVLDTEGRAVGVNVGTWCGQALFIPLAELAAWLPSRSRLRPGL